MDQAGSNQIKVNQSEILDAACEPKRHQTKIVQGPGSAAVSAASSCRVSRQVSLPEGEASCGETPLELAGEDARATAQAAHGYVTWTVDGLTRGTYSRR